MGTFGGNAVRPDLAAEVQSATLTAAGQATSGAQVVGAVNLTVAGTFSGAVVAERSFDGGVNYVPVWIDGYGAALQFIAPGSHVHYEPEPGVLWRLRAATGFSGTATARVSA